MPFIFSNIPEWATLHSVPVELKSCSIFLTVLYPERDDNGDNDNVFIAISGLDGADQSRPAAVRVELQRP